MLKHRIVKSYTFLLESGLPLMQEKGPSMNVKAAIRFLLGPTFKNY